MLRVGHQAGGGDLEGAPPPTFSSRTSSEWVEAGFSMATRHSICSKWFCITSLVGEWVELGSGTSGWEEGAGRSWWLDNSSRVF